MSLIFLIGNTLVMADEAFPPWFERGIHTGFRRGTGILLARDETGLYPTYEVEVIQKSSINGDIIIPLVHRGYLYAFSIIQKLPLWRVFIGGDLSNPFTIYERYVYFYDIYNRVYAIEMDGGRLSWSINIGGEISGRLLIYDNVLIISTLAGGIYVVDRSDGSVLFFYRGEGVINTDISFYKNYIIIPYKNGRISAYDLATRRERWTFRAGGIISVAPIIKGQFIYFGSWDRTFYALDANTGKPIWVSYVGDPITRDFLLFENGIVLFFTQGEMVCLNRENGEIKWVKYFRDLEFNYNYFKGKEEVFVFIPDLIAINPDNGNVLFDYRDRAFSLFKEELFERMVEGKYPLTDDEKSKLLAERFFTVSEYPHLPPARFDDRYIYFITDGSYLYVYDLERNAFILKYWMEKG
ncbi:MAG: outer membrane protein assembly factor BamB family protein [Spirochaetota bacterium]